MAIFFTISIISFCLGFIHLLFIFDIKMKVKFLFIDTSISFLLFGDFIINSIINGTFMNFKLDFILLSIFYIFVFIVCLLIN